MFNPGDLVTAKTPHGEYFGVVVKKLTGELSGWTSDKYLWRLMINGELSHYYFLESQLTIVSKVNV